MSTTTQKHAALFLTAIVAACASSSTPSSGDGGASSTSSSSSSSGAAGDGGGAGCPTKPPASASACSVEGQKCGYVYCDEGGPASATCTSGAWNVFLGDGQCTQRPDGGPGCANGGPACTGGQQCCSGIPYPDEGQCQTTCDAKSDRNAKDTFAPVDGDEVLSKLSRVPITRWSYRERPGVRHVGPMAQDFKAAFEVGADERVINGVDADGVALVAIQALDRHVRALEHEVAQLREKNAELSKECRR